MGLTANAQIPGTFVDAGRMTAERVGHSATLLQDGRVLIFGGGSFTAEIYDPATRTFSAIGTTTRDYAGATLLRDGRVLLAGGIDASHAWLATAELYDPMRNTFTATGSLRESALGPYGMLLTDGRVLFVVGFHQQFDASGHWFAQTAQAEIYDPATGTFSFGASYATPVGYADAPLTITMLADGRVLLAGENPAQIYDPTLDAFTLTPSIPGIAWRYAATALNDGTVLITPREGDMWCSDSPLPGSIYNPSDGTFSPAGQTRKLLGSITRLRDGTVLFAGGGSPCDSVGTAVNDTAELYVPQGRSFLALGRMVQRRMLHVATLLQDGSVLITGGYSSWGFGPGPKVATAELYRPAELPPRRRAARH
jgi:hypothetical protein